jgi:CRP/FNR family cyclic AMP-dependent transcriptional regulator
MPAGKKPAPKRKAAPSKAAARVAPKGGVTAPPVSLEELRRIPAFAGLSDADAGQLLAVMSIRNVARGESIFREGELGDGLYAILQGKISIFKRNPKGGEREVVVLEKCEVCGEMDLISDRPHTAGARGAEGSTLLFLPRSEFQSLLLQGNPGATAMVMYFARMLAGRLDSANKKMMEILATPEPKANEFLEFKKRLLKEWTF